MTGRLAEKVALITGGCSGIGLATVELFLAEGAAVVAADLQDEKGLAMQNRYGQRLRYIHCNVAEEADIAAAVALAQQQFGGLDILFNNAGIVGSMAPITDVTAAEWDGIFAILARGPALGIKHAAPPMAARGGGSIINTASVAALEAGLGPVAYSCAKAAALHLSRIAAAQLAPQQIRVNAICPGLIATSIFGDSIGLDRVAADRLAERIPEVGGEVQPIRRAGRAADIAEAALYLASDASAFVTGTHLVVDGGITVGPRHAWDPTAPSPLRHMFKGLADERR